MEDADQIDTITVSDTAWSLGVYDTVFDIITADGPYPKDFKTEKFSVKQSCKIKARLLKTEKFHKKIKEKSFKEASQLAEELIQEGIKIAYDANNISALSVALECENFEMYAFLRLKGFACGIDVSHYILLKTLKKRKKLNDEIAKYFKHPNFHILDLLSKSRLGMHNDIKHFDKLKEYFEKLDNNTEIRPILKIVTKDKDLSLIFDFNKEDIENLEPTACADDRQYMVRGRTYKETKKILIAAKQRSDSKLLGILAQELTHFAVQMVYKNDFLPYHSNDFCSKAKYAEIVNVCRVHRNREKIIDAVYKYEDEDKIKNENKIKKENKIKDDNIIAAELIARVPQLIAQNEPEKLSKNRETFRDLFDYFYEKVCKDIEFETKRIKLLQNIRDLNRSFGVLHHMKTYEMRVRESKTDSFEKCKNIFIPTKFPELVLSNIIEDSRLNDSENIFVELQQLTISSILEQISETIDECFKPIVYVIDSGSVDNKCASEALLKVNKSKTVFISSRSLGDFQNLPDRYESCSEVYFLYEEVRKDTEKLIKLKQNVQSLNKTFGVLHHMKAFKMRVPDTKTGVFEKWKNIFIPTKLPKLALSNIIEGFRLNDSENIFVKLKQLTMRSKNDSIDEINDECFKPTIYVIDSKSVDHKSAFEALHKMDKLKTVFISSRPLDEFQNLRDQYESCSEVKYTFSDLDSKSQQQILTSEVDFQGSKVILKNIFGDDLEKIALWPLEDLQSASEVRINNFEECLPKICEVFMPRSFEISENKEILTAEDVVVKVETEKTIVIVNVAGMGKTTSAVNLAKLLKVANPLHWIVFFDLKQYSEVFENQKTRRSNLELILQRMVNLEKEIEKKLFNFCFKNSKNIFVIDGFDEISPKYKTFVLNLMQHIQRFGNRLLVATRTHLKSELVAELGFMPLSLEILPFSEDNQLEFLVKFWSQKPDHVRVENLKKKAEQLIKKFEVHLSREKVSLKIPLQLFLLADLAETNPDFVDFDFKLFSLYEHFIKNKLDVYNKKGLLASTDNTTFQMKQFNILLFHQIIAIETFFGRKVADLFGSLEIPENLSKDEICRIGFLQIGFNGRYQFNHQDFGVFFAAQKLVESVTTTNSVSILHELLAKVFVRDSHYDENIRSFINAKLGESENFYHITDISQKLEEKVEDEDTHGFLIRLIREKQYNLIKFIFKKLLLNNELKLKIMKYKDSSRYNALHFAAMDSSEAWEVVWECIESSENTKELKKILQTGGGNDNISIFELLYHTKGVDFEALQENLKDIYFQDPPNILSLLRLEESNKKMFAPSQLVWNAIEENFEPEHQKAIFFEQSEGNLFENMNSSSRGIQLVLTAAKKLYNAEELHERILESIRKQNVIYVSSLDNREIITNFLEEFLFTEEDKREFENFCQNERIQQNEADDFSETAFFSRILDALYSFGEQPITDPNLYHSLLDKKIECFVQISVQISASHNFEFFSLFWNFVSQRSAQKFQTILLLGNYKTTNALASATRNTDGSVYKFILNKIKELSDSEFFIERGITVFLGSLYQCAAVAKREDFEILWQFLQEKYDIENQQNQILKEFRIGERLLMGCKGNRNEATIRFIINKVGDILTSDDFTAALQFDFDLSGSKNWLFTALLYFASMADLDTFKTFWSLFQKKLSPKELNALFLKRGLQNSNLMIISAANENEATIEFIIKLAGEILSPKDFGKAAMFEAFTKYEKDELSKVINEYGTDLQYVFSTGWVNLNEDGIWLSEALCAYAKMLKPETFEKFWLLVETKIDVKGQKALVLGEGSCNLIKAVAANRNEATVQHVFSLAEKLLVQNDFKTVLLSKSWLTDTLCFYASMASPIVFKRFWSFLKKFLSKRDGKKAFKQSEGPSESGLSKMNVLASASRNKNESTVALVVYLAEKLLDRKQFEKALDSDTVNWLDISLHHACNFAGARIFDMIWKFLSKDLNKNERKAIFLKKNEEGENALMICARNRNKATIELVIDLATDLLDHKDIIALESGGNSWLDCALHLFTSLAGPESFQRFWSFLQKYHPSKKEQKAVFLKRNEKGENAFMISVLNKNKATIELVIKTAKNLLDKDDFDTALKSGSKNWLTDALCEYASKTELESFALLWRFLQDNIHDINEQKRLLLRKNQNGQSALKCVFKNKDNSTRKYVYNKVRK